MPLAASLGALGTASVDLLRKSGGTRAGEIAECRDQLNSKGELMTPMSIYALQHTKDLHPTNDMLNTLPSMCQHTVFLALVGREGRRSRRLMGRDSVPMTSPQSLISGISDQGRVVGKPHAD